jgi:hypothetical protein
VEKASKHKGLAGYQMMSWSDYEDLLAGLANGKAAPVSREISVPQESQLTSLCTVI